MELLFAKSKWEMPEASLDDFLRRSVNDGFDAVEVFLQPLETSAHEIRRRIADYGLRLVAHVISQGNTPVEHLESLRRQIDFAAQTEALFINCHSGRDIFTFAENYEIIDESDRRGEALGLWLTHETHRGRPTFNLPDTARYLDALPGMRLNADFSHWFCVHESDLSDQAENMAKAISRSWYIHARVGFEQGPQVPDPLAPEWLGTTAKFVALWQRILDARNADGMEILTITPEFGPPPYMPCEPYTRRPMADTWTVNVAFMQYLRETLVY